MPGRADYWKYFIVQEMLAVCQIAGCTKPNVSLGPLPKAGEKKRISMDLNFGVSFVVTVVFQQLELSLIISWRTTSRSGMSIVRCAQGSLQRWIKPRRTRKKPARWKTVRCDSTMSGQARVVYHFYKRWASVFFFSCLFIMFIFRFFLTFVSPQCIGLIQTQEL